MKKIKLLPKSFVPYSVIRHINRYRNGVFGEDSFQAWKLKRKFFWAAFKALDYNGIDGDYVEFGSHGGKTFRLAHNEIWSRKIKRHMWSFDSFEGLPDNASQQDYHPKWQKGTMSTGLDAFHRICQISGIKRERYTTVKGYYDDTLPKLGANDAPNNIALAYVDCDLYSSTKTVLEFLEPRLKHGMIIAFDDYFCWSENEISGERKAQLEFLSKNTKWNFLRYRDYGWAGASFVVERTES